MKFIDKIGKHIKKNISFVQRITEIKQIETIAASDSNKISPTDLLEKVAELLANAHLKFAIAGGFARSVHASPRATGDVDIVVAIKDLNATKDVLQTAGFQFKETLDYQKPTRLILKYEYQGRELDIINYQKYPQFVDFLLQTTSTKTLFKSSYPFLGLEGLIVTKLCSFRYKDKADLVDLIELKPDLNIIKNWCSALDIMARFSFMSEDHSKEK